MSDKSPLEQAADEMISIHRKAFEALIVAQECKTIDELAEKAKEANAAKEGKQS